MKKKLISRSRIVKSTSTCLVRWTKYSKHHLKESNSQILLCPEILVLAKVKKNEIDWHVPTIKTLWYYAIVRQGE